MVEKNNVNIGPGDPVEFNDPRTGKTKRGLVKSVRGQIYWVLPDGSVNEYGFVLSDLRKV